MSNLDFLKVQPTAQTAPAAAPAPKKTAENWLNFGRTFTFPDGNGGTEEVFVSAFGVPVDLMSEPKPYTGKNERMRHINEAKTLMLKLVQEAAAAMASGDALPVNGLEAELRRVGVAQASAEGENPALAQIASTISIG